MKQIYFAALLLMSPFMLLSQEKVVLIDSDISITELTAINSPGSEFGPYLTKTGLLYTSSEGPERNTDKETGKAVFRLLYAPIVSGNVQESTETGIS